MKNEDLVLKNLGIIAGRAIHWWKFLPEEVRATYDVDDLISDCVLQCIRAAKKYKKKRAMTTTFVWWVSDNRCKSILAYYGAQMRGPGKTVSLTNILRTIAAASDEGPQLRQNVELLERVKSSALEPESMVESKQLVEEVLKIATPECRRFLEAILLGSHYRPSQQVRAELQEISTYLVKANFADFQNTQAYLAHHATV